MTWHRNDKQDRAPHLLKGWVMEWDLQTWHVLHPVPGSMHVLLHNDVQVCARALTWQRRYSKDLLL